MPAARNAASSTYEIDQRTNTLRFERDFDTGPERVFEAWTRPEHVRQWWDASGKPLVRCDIDLRVGGSFAFVVEDHPEMPFAGVYREIVPGERLVFDALGSTGKVELHRRGRGTRMTVEIACPTSEQLEQYVRMGVAIGTATTLDNLVRHVGGELARAADDDGGLAGGHAGTSVSSMQPV